MGFRPNLFLLLVSLFSSYNSLSCRNQESYAPEPPQRWTINPEPSQTSGVYSPPTLAEANTHHPSFATSLLSKRNLRRNIPETGEDKFSGFDAPYSGFPYPPIHKKKKIPSATAKQFIRPKLSSQRRPELSGQVLPIALTHHGSPTKALNALSCSSRVLHAQESYALEPPQIRSLLTAKVPVPMASGGTSDTTLADLPSFAISLSSRRNLRYKNPAAREDSSSGFDAPYKEFPYPPFHGKKDP